MSVFVYIQHIKVMKRFVCLYILPNEDKLLIVTRFIWLGCLLYIGTYGDEHSGAHAEYNAAANSDGNKNKYRLIDLPTGK